MNCVRCEIELSGGLDTCGSISEPYCLSCWLCGWELDAEDDYDFRADNLPEKERKLLGQSSMCYLCDGRGYFPKRMDIRRPLCFKCEGSGWLRARICALCDGKAEVEHKCEENCSCEGEFTDGVAPCTCCNGVCFDSVAAPITTERIRRHWVTAV